MGSSCPFSHVHLVGCLPGSILRVLPYRQGVILPYGCDGSRGEGTHLVASQGRCCHPPRPRVPQSKPTPGGRGFNHGLSQQSRKLDLNDHFQSCFSFVQFNYFLNAIPLGWQPLICSFPSFTRCLATLFFFLANRGNYVCKFT